MSGVVVSISSPGATAPAAVTSDANGKAVFPGLTPGEWTITGSKVGYTQWPATPPVTAAVSAPDDPANPTRATITLKSDLLECERKHGRPPTGTASGQSLALMFWSSEPWIFVLRDVLFLTFIVGAALSVVLGLVYAPPGNSFAPGALAAGAICLAYVGYFSNVIFGMAVGIPLIIIASIVFIGILVSAIVGAAGSSAMSFLGFPPPDLWGFPMLCGMWTGFLTGMLPGRLGSYSSRSIVVPVVIPAIAAVVVGVTVLLLFIFLVFKDPFAAWGVSNGVAIFLLILVAVIGSAVLGGAAGLLGCTFCNEGRTELSFLDATTSGYPGYENFLLPYNGERYCVQGHRGFVSHFNGQEPSYDFSLPEGAPVLAGKEGHIVAFKETLTGNVRTTPRNENPNYVAIRHRDGTVSKHLHLQTGSVSAVNPRANACVATHSDENAVTGPATHAANPLHVFAGNQIARNDDVGISMFPHIHMYVYSPAQSHSVAFKFRDAGVARHDGRCWSMRKYRSSNVDAGPVQIPPPAAGGPP